MIRTTDGAKRKKRAKESVTSPRRIADHERAIKAVELRKAGVNYENIAKALGFADRHTARQCVARALETALLEPSQELITMEQMRLDSLLQAVWGSAVKGDKSSIDRALKIMERRAKLLGLDRPAKFEAEVTAVGGVLVVPGVSASVEMWASEGQGPGKEE